MKTAVLRSALLASFALASFAQDVTEPGMAVQESAKPNDDQLYSAEFDPDFAADGTSKEVFDISELSEQEKQDLKEQLKADKKASGPVAFNAGIEAKGSKKSKKTSAQEQEPTAFSATNNSTNFNVSFAGANKYGEAGPMSASSLASPKVASLVASALVAFACLYK